MTNTTKTSQRFQVGRQTGDAELTFFDASAKTDSKLILHLDKSGKEEKGECER